MPDLEKVQMKNMNLRPAQAAFCLLDLLVDQLLQHLDLCCRGNGDTENSVLSSN
jgi:hypothetical protein